MTKRKSFLKDKLRIEIFSTSEDIGEAAAKYVHNKLMDAIHEKGSANLILGTGASQFNLHAALLSKDIDWGRINLFHLDEYLGMSNKHPASFRKFLKDRIADKVNPRNVFYINGDAKNINSEIERYELLLRSNSIDVACIGIGENGHIAFNDPTNADFNEKDYLKVVELDEMCRKQQTGEGWFPSFDEVPKKAATLTAKAIMDCRSICCTVPDERKSDAVFNTLTGEIRTSCPASILRTHKEAVLFLDQYSSIKILDLNFLINN